MTQTAPSLSTHSSSPSRTNRNVQWQTMGAALLIVVAAATLMGGPFVVDVHNMWVNIMYGAFAVATAGWLLTGRLAAHLFARGFSWGVLSIFLVSTYLGRPAEQGMSALIVVLLSGAMLVLGRSGLTNDQKSGFAPAAFRSSLLVGLVGSIFLCVWLSLMNVAIFSSTTHDQADYCAFAILGGSMVALLTSTAGLLRLQMWALLVKTIIDALVVALVAILVVADAPALLSVAIGLFAVANFAIDLNVLYACVRGAKYRPRSFANLTWWIVPLASIVAASSAVAMFAMDFHLMD